MQTLLRLKSLAFPLSVLAAVAMSFSCVPGDKSLSEKQDIYQGQDRALVNDNQRLRKEVHACKQQYAKLKRSVKPLEETRKGLEKELNLLRLRLLEKETEVKDLEKQRASLQEQLAEAIQEVVRAKAKLRSLESRAEAASNMAETEIALKALKKRGHLNKDDPSISRAEQLLKMSYKEFEKGNYGGALYLANQAKGHLKDVQLHTKADPMKPLPGEIPFSVPISLRVSKTSNLREGPGLNYKIVSTLKPGVALVGYSRMDEWINVKTESGVKGWIFQELVKGR